MANLGAYTGVLTSVLGVIGTSKDIKNKNKQVLEQIGNESEAFGHGQGVSQQQAKDLTRVFQDQMSASGMESMKAEARLRAASAETGTTGGATDTEVIQTAKVNQLHQEAALMRSYDIQKSNQYSKMIADRLNFETDLENLTNSMQSPESAGLSIFSSGLSGMNSGLGMMSGASKRKFYGTNIDGE